MPQRKTRKATTKSELARVVEVLTDEIRVLREAVDELREEVQWANHNHPHESPASAGRHIQSCSLDPTSSNFEVNTVDEATVEKLRSELTPIRRLAGKQGELFD